MHGGNLISLKTILFTTFILVSFNAAALDVTQGISNQSLDFYIKNKRFHISKTDKRIAINLTKIFDISKDGYTNRKLTKSLLAQVKKSRAFHIYINWLRDILAIDGTKSISYLRKKCSQLADMSNENALRDVLNENSTNLCLKKYLKILGKIDSKSIKHFKELEFVHDYIANFLEPQNKQSFKYFLSQLAKDSYSHKEYSKIYTQHFIQKNISPDKDMLQYVHITPDFTRYIQLRGVEDYSTNYVFHEELEKLIKASYLAAEDKKDKEEVVALTKKAINYYNLSQQYLPKSKSKKHVLSLAKSLLRRNYYKSADLVFSSLILNFPKDEDLLFEKMWVSLTRENYSDAYNKVIKPQGLDDNFKDLKDERLQFWTALTLKEINKTKYKAILENLISKSPLSYYSILSSKLLADNSKIETDKIFFKHAHNPDLIPNKLPTLDKYTIRSLKRLKVWGELDFKPFISLELKNLVGIHSNEVTRLNKGAITKERSRAVLTLLSTRILNSIDNHLESFKIVYKGFNNNWLSLDKTVLENLFPKPFYNTLKKYQKDLDPLVALSLIRQESGFNHKARSHAGARGLMQIMPATARRFQRVSAHHLYKPYLNLKIGTKYLNLLYKKYDENLVYTLSAYNAGETRVKRWRKRYLTNDSTLHNIENIPFLETRKYVKLIFRNIFFYKMLNESQELNDTNSTNKIYDIYLGFNSYDK